MANCLYLFIFRTILSAIHFNYNLRRENKVDDQGNIKVKVTNPKFKDGKATVREIKVEQNYGTYRNGLMFLSTVLMIIQCNNCSKKCYARACINPVPIM